MAITRVQRAVVNEDGTIAIQRRNTSDIPDEDIEENPDSVFEDEEEIEAEDDDEDDDPSEDDPSEDDEEDEEDEDDEDDDDDATVDPEEPAAEGGLSPEDTLLTLAEHGLPDEIIEKLLDHPEVGDLETLVVLVDGEDQPWYKLVKGVGSKTAVRIEKALKSLRGTEG